MLDKTVNNPILDHLSTAVVLLDADLRIQYLNPAAEDLLECSLHKYRGEKIKNVLFLDGEWEQELLQVIEKQTPFTRRQIEVHLRGIQRSIHVDYTVSAFMQGEAPMLVIEMQALDRLLRISREEALLSNEQVNRTFIRGLAHEIKNPLGGIRGAAQLLSRELEKPEQRDYTQVIMDEADRLRNLVDRMLGMNRPLSLKQMNIHEVLERVIALAEVEVKDRIKLFKDYDPSLPDISGDKEQLVQVLLNIVRNAVQALDGAMPDQPCITLKTRAQHHFTIGHQQHRLVCRVDVIDNGPGIPEHLLDNIFYPMITGRAEGTGLGLAIAQSIVIQHRGLIECNSVPGETIFSLYLPLIAEEGGMDQ